MAVLAVFMLLMLCGSVLTSGESITEACSTHDFACLKTSTEKFFEQTHKGIPDWNIVKIDPLVIPSLDVVFDTDGVIYKNRNLTVTGLRKQQITEFEMDTAAKSVVYTLNADLVISGDVTVTNAKSSTSFSGYYTSQGTAKNTISYEYELKTDDKGVKHFYIGPETITCTVEVTPKVERSPEIVQGLANDPFFKTLSQEKLEDLRKKAFCKVTQKSYTYVVHNIRQAAKLLPSSTFFSDIQ